MTDAKITQKIVLKGSLQLDSPLLIGSGTETENRKNEADIHILRDKKERPFVPGTSLAGVLRNWLAEQNADAADKLFGFIIKGKNKNNEQDTQSAIAISDVVFKNEDTEVVVRNGVSIDSYTGTGIKGAKYDYEVLERGAKGDFKMVITIREYQEKQLPNLHALVQLLADKLCSGIRVGALTSKGFGNVSVPDMTVDCYDFRKKENVKRWLLKQDAVTRYAGKKLVEDTVNTLLIDGEFSLQTSLLIRNQDVDERVNDTVQLAAVPLQSKAEYLIPGTSLKGVLRHQAEKILTALQKPESWLDDLMGYSKDSENQKKSRFITNEVYFKKGVKESIQTRNRIDRFTGSTIENALFANKALWQEQQGLPVLHVHFEIQECKNWEAGLALFLLKDLWNGKIALGGDKSVGRGLLQGHSATVMFKGKKYRIGENGQTDSETRETFERFAAALIHKEKEGAEA